MPQNQYLLLYAMQHIRTMADLANERNDTTRAIAKYADEKLNEYLGLKDMPQTYGLR